MLCKLQYKLCTLILCTVHCAKLQIAILCTLQNCALQIANYKLCTANYKLQTVHCKLQYKLSAITLYWPTLSNESFDCHDIFPILYFPCYISRIIFPILYFPCYISHVIFSILYFSCKISHILHYKMVRCELFGG